MSHIKLTGYAGCQAGIYRWQAIKSDSQHVVIKIRAQSFESALEKLQRRYALPVRKVG